jgi:hypothetical protein
VVAFNRQASLVCVIDHVIAMSGESPRIVSVLCHLRTVATAPAILLMPVAIVCVQARAFAGLVFWSAARVKAIEVPPGYCAAIDLI